jgi:hypothetical protein
VDSSRRSGIANLTANGTWTEFRRSCRGGDLGRHLFIITPRVPGQDYRAHCLAVPRVRPAPARRRAEPSEAGRDRDPRGHPRMLEEVSGRSLPGGCIGAGHNRATPGTWRRCSSGTPVRRISFGVSSTGMASCSTSLFRADGTPPPPGRPSDGCCRAQPHFSAMNSMPTTNPHAGNQPKPHCSRSTGYLYTRRCWYGRYWHGMPPNRTATVTQRHQPLSRPCRLLLL